MSKTPPITVLIPTRERADVLRYCLETVTTQRYENLQILVSDNFSCDHTREVVLSNADTRIRYIRTPHRMGMSEHWEWALDHVQPGWLGIVGDDDGLTVDCIDNLLDVISIPEIDAIRTRSAHFTWPGTTADDRVGRLAVYRRAEQPAQVLSPAQELERALDGSIPFSRLPFLYTSGWARTACVDAARDIAGRFYKSAIPDLYSAVALAKTARRTAYLDKLLAIDGGSRHSNGRAHILKDSAENQEKIASFWSETKFEFHSSIPRRCDGALSLNTYGFYLECLLQADHLYSDTASRWRTHVERAMLSYLANPWTNTSEAEFAWTQELARMHGVDPEEAWWSARRRRIAHLLSPRAWQSKCAEWAGRDVIESPELTTVAEAARFLNRTRGWRPPISHRATSVAAGVGAAISSAIRNLARPPAVRTKGSE